MVVVVDIAAAVGVGLAESKASAIALPVRVVAAEVGTGPVDMARTPAEEQEVEPGAAGTTGDIVTAMWKAQEVAAYYSEAVAPGKVAVYADARSVLDAQTQRGKSVNRMGSGLMHMWG